MKQKPPFRIDVGAGRRPRGDLGVTAPGEGGAVDITEGIDPNLEMWGWAAKEGTPLLRGDLEGLAAWEAAAEHIPPRTVVHTLFSHSLEHLLRPYTALERASAIMGSETITVVVPNASVSRADWVDEGHLYSWTAASLYHLLSRFGAVTKTGYFGPALDLAMIVERP